MGIGAGDIYGAGSSKSDSELLGENPVVVTNEGKAKTTVSLDPDFTGQVARNTDDIAELQTLVSQRSRTAVVDLGGSDVQADITAAFNSYFVQPAQPGDKLFDDNASSGLQTTTWIYNNAGTWVQIQTDYNLFDADYAGLIRQPPGPADGDVVAKPGVPGVGTIYGWPSSLSAAANTDTDTSTPALSGTLSALMQTIWAKIRSVVNALATKVTANAAITGATKAKITYDSKGLVTAGADLAAADIPELPQSKITGLPTDLAAKAPANVALTATTNTDTTTSTDAVASASVASVMQTIWAKIRSVVNALGGEATARANADTALQASIDTKTRVIAAASIPAGVNGSAFCRIAEFYDDGEAWYSRRLICDIFGSNDTNEHEPTRIYLSVERAGTANGNLYVNNFTVNGSGNVQAYVQKESDNYIRVYANAVTSNNQATIIYYAHGEYGLNSSHNPGSVGTAISSLPNAGGTNGTLARVQGTKIRALPPPADPNPLAESGTAQPAGNSLVRRTPNGYVYATYFQQSSAQEDESDISNGGFFYYVSQAADRYFRKISAAAFRRKLLGALWNWRADQDATQYVSGDMNQDFLLRNTGFWWVNASSNAPYNGWGGLINIRHRMGGGSDGHLYGDQIFIGSQNAGQAGRMWTRSHNNGTWTAWVEKANKADLYVPTRLEVDVTNSNTSYGGPSLTIPTNVTNLVLKGSGTHRRITLTQEAPASIVYIFNSGSDRINIVNGISGIGYLMNEKDFAIATNNLTSLLVYSMPSGGNTDNYSLRQGIWR